MGNMSSGCCNFISPSSTTGRTDPTNSGNLAGKVNVNEEYKQAVRTNSFIEISDKVQTQLRRKSLQMLESSTSASLHPKLTEYLLEPQQEILIDDTNLHHLIADYFKASCQACITCELLLRSVYQARANNTRIRKAIKLTKYIRDSLNYKKSVDSDFDTVFEELSLFSVLRNPLHAISPGEFRDTQKGHRFLLKRLVKKFKKIKQRAKLTKFCKNVAGVSLVISYAGVATALLVLAIHSAVGIIAAPGIIGCSLGLAKKKGKMVTDKFRTSTLERSSAQFEVAAKGVFILINDFDTMSRLVGRLQDEIDHNKAIADMCVKNGKREVLMEVVREFRINQSCFLEQLEELEEHIYLCFLTINKSRTLVMQEIMVLQQENSTNRRS